MGAGAMVRASQRRVCYLVVAILVELAIQICAIAILYQRHNSAQSSTPVIEYIDDYAQVLGSTSKLPSLPLVRMHIEESVHYAMDPWFDREWDALVPANTIGAEDGDDIYTTAMFHQLYCLKVLRLNFSRLRFGQQSGSDTDLAMQGHCLNYLRQSTLCHGDMHLEAITEAGNAESTHEYACRDWTAVYEAMR
ncbi:hypothetical protein BDW22DRAFT_1350073 [Trametopsis cervina]|nr:hypothetical protein BDW22DRAFT_1350073 [Trametopsis cervina]